MHSHICLCNVCIEKRNISRRKPKKYDRGHTSIAHPFSPYYPVAFFDNIVVSSLKRLWEFRFLSRFFQCFVCHSSLLPQPATPLYRVSVVVNSSTRLGHFVFRPYQSLYQTIQWAVSCFSGSTHGSFLRLSPTRLVFDFPSPLTRPNWISHFLVRYTFKFRIKTRKTRVQSTNKSNNVKSYVYTFTGLYLWRPN